MTMVCMKPNSISSIMASFHKAGYRIMFACIGISLILSLFLHSLAFDILALFVCAGVCYFFRDPNRMIPVDANLILSPADGVVSFINFDISPPDELGMPDKNMTQISIFLSLADVHVNRLPVSGIIENMVYTSGEFRNLFLNNVNDRAQTCERQAIAIKDSNGNGFAVVQIAGRMAKRIVCEVKVGDSVKRGNRFGIICFGSRVDLYVPSHVNLAVCQGQTVVGGETVMAVYRGDGIGECESV